MRLWACISGTDIPGGHLPKEGKGGLAAIWLPALLFLLYSYSMWTSKLYAAQYDMTLSPFGERVLTVLLEVFGGDPPREIRSSSFDEGYCVAVRVHGDEWLTTAGDSYLSRLIVASHGYKIKVAVRPGSSQSLTILFFASPREGEGMCSLDTLIDNIAEA